MTRKITSGVARIAAGKSQELRLGNLEAKRDWGYAPEYVEMMWRMLQQEEPDDFVVATGEDHTVAEFCKEAFAHAGVPNWRRHVKVDRQLIRPAEVHELRGDASKAKRLLGWVPKVRFKDLVKIMVDADMELLSK